MSVSINLPLLSFNSFTRITNVLTKKDVLLLEDLIPFVVPLTMYLFGGDYTLYETLTMYAIMLIFSGLVLGVIIMRVGHHHPEVFHDGDPVRYVRISIHIEF